MSEQKKKYTLEAAITYLEGKTLGMSALDKYNYLEARFNDAMNVGDMEEGSKAYYVFRSIIKILNELELEIKGLG